MQASTFSMASVSRSQISFHPFLPTEAAAETWTRKRQVRRARFAVLTMQFITADHAHMRPCKGHRPAIKHPLCTSGHPASPLYHRRHTCPTGDTAASAEATSPGALWPARGQAFPVPRRRLSAPCFMPGKHRGAEVSPQIACRCAHAHNAGEY